MATRYIVNFLIGGMWVLFFNALGWITLRAQPHTLNDPTLGHLVDAAIIAIAIAFMGEVASFLWLMFVVFTLGLGCLLLPFYWLLVGYIKLALASFLLPGWFSYSHNLICVIIMSWVLGASRWHSQDELRRGPPQARPSREVAAEWQVLDDK